MKYLKTSISITLLTCFFSLNAQSKTGLTINSVKKSIMITPQNHIGKLSANKLNLPKVLLYRLEKEQSNTFLKTRVESKFNRKLSPWERFLFDPPFSINLMGFL